MEAAAAARTRVAAVVLSLWKMGFWEETPFAGVELEEALSLNWGLEEGFLGKWR